MSLNGRPWNDVTVVDILTNPKYAGSNVWNRRTCRLHSPLTCVDPQFWITKPLAFAPIVDQQTFDRAQATIQRMRDSHWSAERVLKRVRSLLNTKGKLSERIFLEARGTPSTGTIRKYFGTYRNLYKMLNYQPEYCHVYRVEQARRSASIRQALGENLTKLFPENVEVFLSRRGARSILRVDNTFMVSILFCRHEKPFRRVPKRRSGKAPGPKPSPWRCWGATPAPAEREHITLLCLMSKRFDRILDFYVVNRMGDRAYMRLRRNGEFLRRAIKLDSLRDFYAAVTRLWKRRKANPEIAL